MNRTPLDVDADRLLFAHHRSDWSGDILLSGIVEILPPEGEKPSGVASRRRRAILTIPPEAFAILVTEYLAASDDKIREISERAYEIGLREGRDHGVDKMLLELRGDIERSFEGIRKRLHRDEREKPS